jgi:hypothetical protein
LSGLRRINQSDQIVECLKSWNTDTARNGVTGEVDCGGVAPDGGGCTTTTLIVAGCSVATALRRVFLGIGFFAGSPISQTNHNPHLLL